MVKEILCALLDHGYTQCTHSPQEIFRQQKIALAVQDTTSKAHVEQCVTTAMGNCPDTRPSGLSPVWLINTLLSPYQAKKGVGESTKAALVSYVMSAKRHCQMLVLRTVTNPKSTPLTSVQYVSMHCVLILVLGYITLKRTIPVK